MKFNLKVLMLAQAAWTTSVVSSTQCLQDLGAEVKLCGSDAVYQQLGNGENECLKGGETMTLNMNSCCSIVETVKKTECEKDVGLHCREVGFSGAFCSSQAGECSNLSSNDKLMVTFNREFAQESSCCKTCSCYGDPHCSGFDKQTDTWVLCDGREIQGKNQCSVTKHGCGSQMDHKGNSCNYIQKKKKKKWQYGLKGSRCRPNFAQSGEAQITMYEFDGFKLKLGMGERAIIETIYLTTNGKEYTLNSRDCYNYFGTGEQSAFSANAWSTSEGTGGIPDSWEAVPDKQHDILWKITDDNGVNLKIRCTRPRVQVKNQVKLGPPRIDIEELAEPYAHTRNQVDGFCASSVINKGMDLSSNNVGAITASSLCSKPDEAATNAVKALCKKGYGIEPCQLLFCENEHEEGGYASKQFCFEQILIKSWIEVFCTIRAPLNKFMECFNEIIEFGWAVGVPKYPKRTRNKKVANGGNCGTVQDFKNMITNEDVGECERGFTMQYQIETIDGQGRWMDYLFIPDSAMICDNNVLTFDGVEDASVIQNPIRFVQCDVPSECKATKSCLPETGVSIDVKFFSFSETVDNLIEEGSLACYPYNEANPMYCLGDGYTPPAELQCTEKAGCCECANN